MDPDRTVVRFTRTVTSSSTLNGAMELTLDDGDERAVGVETTVLLRSGDAYVVPRGIWHRLESVEPSYLIHVTPGPDGGHRPRDLAQD